MILIKKVLNSSVVLVDKNGEEMIALGKGIGFSKKVGDIIEEKKIDRVFISSDKSQNEHILDFISDIPLEYFEITKKIVDLSEKKLKKQVNNSIFITLTDHIHFAVERYQKGIIIVNKLYWEIKSYYPNEFTVGLESLEVINTELSVGLPKEEAANIAFHLINATSESEATDGLAQAKLIGGIVNIIRYSLKEQINTSSIHYARFITHVKFFVERFFTEDLLENNENELYKQMWALYPAAMEISEKVREYVIKMHDRIISNEELVYLGVHINRLMNSIKSE